MRPGAAVVLASASLLVLAPGAPPTAAPPLPVRMADTGGGSQLITAQAPRAEATSGTVTWWNLRDGTWTKAGSCARPLRRERARRGRLPQTEHEHHSHRAVRPPLRLRHQEGAQRYQGRVPAGAAELLVVPGQRLAFLQPLDRAPPRRLPGRRIRAPDLVPAAVRARVRHRFNLRQAGSRARRGDLPARQRAGSDGRLCVRVGGGDAGDPDVGRSGPPAAHRDRHGERAHGRRALLTSPRGNDRPLPQLNCGLIGSLNTWRPWHVPEGQGAKPPDPVPRRNRDHHDRRRTCRAAPDDAPDPPPPLPRRPAPGRRRSRRGRSDLAVVEIHPPSPTPPPRSSRRAGSPGCWADTMRAGLLLMARVPALERRVGPDRVARWHAMRRPLYDLSARRARRADPARVLREGRAPASWSGAVTVVLDYPDMSRRPSARAPAARSGSPRPARSAAG